MDIHMTGEILDRAEGFLLSTIRLTFEEGGPTADFAVIALGSTEPRQLRVSFRSAYYLSWHTGLENATTSRMSLPKKIIGSLLLDEFLLLMRQTPEGCATVIAMPYLLHGIRYPGHFSLDLQEAGLDPPAFLGHLKLSPR